ncbi:serpin B [Musa troglodytarum]|uniref:Serpin B n=1 Tax=Musa troglodytarum TaxID=320322 RepID=A0A9E7JPQ3_9LILI|nr:serpin B [Musa troglodytarum]
MIKADRVTGAINNWVERKTEGTIKDLLPVGSLDSLTRLVLANALHFQARWAEKFEKSNTKHDEFHLLTGETILVPFMTGGGSRCILCFDGFKALSLSYDRYSPLRLSMLIFLPDNRDGLFELMDRVLSTPGFIKAHSPKALVPVGKFMLPKFKFSFEMEASEALESLGLRAPFSGVDADLKGIFNSPPPENYFISAIRHKSTIQVDEKGPVPADLTDSEDDECCCCCCWGREGGRTCNS